MRMLNTKARITRSIGLLSMVLILRSPGGFANQSQPFPDDFALEIFDDHGRSRFIRVPAATGEVWARYEFKRIVNWQRPADQPADASVIQLKCRVEGDFMKIDLSLLFGGTEQSSLPAGVARTLPRGGLEGQLIASYSARVNEAVSFQELANFGIEPFIVNVVSARAHAIDAGQIVSKVKAVQIVRVAKDPYLIALKNISSKNIIAWRTLGPDGLASFWSKQILLAAGEITEFGLMLIDREQVPGKPPFVIAAVVFEDLTYEGDKEPAITVAAARRAGKIQAARILVLLREAIRGLAEDSRKALENLRLQASALSIEAEDQPIAELTKRFSPLTEAERMTLLRELNGSLMMGRKRILTLIKIHEMEETSKGISRKSWLTELEQMYDKWVNE